MKRLLDAVCTAICNRFGFVVYAHWEDDCVKHYGRDSDEAIEWMACYPASAECVVYNMWGRLVASRIQCD